ncbi:MULTISPECIES: DUF1523 family protein [unclassified Paracoccus (in: a-proteobacteria)]|uniref:DUF1523 family protein n=1 Tax=unclassified Paracoccus (in: a-proteobacteria) TaxID=2688777 RepID=UPI0021E159D9|nr:MULTISPECIES: DUF1523 family protein [unclassified Paracoccus (in: a-proteobacteria)]UXU73914.1 DUF1523 family protein [Paracoccus sp. SMMA_5]UXU79801.1 DUF1523 family protein [Paracoccus sp. SMMA_5_TC]
MRWFLTVLGVSFGIVVFLFLDYSLPSRQTVRITNTYNRLTDIGANRIFYASPDTGTVQNAQGQRDVRFIDTVRPNGRPYVYRNEDTGWIWPPYFKYDSSNLHAKATDLKSTAANPEWVSITSYGWRVAWLSIYPNAISIKPVSGPQDRPFNWPAAIILLLLGALLALIWRMWNQFRERTIDPAVRSADQTWDRIDARADAARDHIAAEAAQARGRVGRWWSGLWGRR